AGGHKTAMAPQMRADVPLVQADQPHERRRDHGLSPGAAGGGGAGCGLRTGRPAFFSSTASVRLTCVLFRWGVRARATKIISYPPLFGERFSAKAARITRRARLRCTAPPTFLVAVSPTRVTPRRFLATYSTRCGCT